MTTPEEFIALAKEPLCDDLVAHLREVDGLGTVLHHPLVVSVPLGLPGHLNRYYEQQKERLERTPMPEKAWVYERPYRLPMLMKWWDEGLVEPNDKLRSVLPGVWTDTEGDDTIDDPDVVRFLDCLRAVGFLSDDEHVPAPLRALTVFRGGEANGIAWSTSRETANWFAHRYKLKGEPPEPLLKAQAPPAAVLARFFGRNENEVIVDPNDLENVERLQ